MSLLVYARSHGNDVAVVAAPGSALHEACREVGVRSEPAEFTLSPSHLQGLRTVLRELQPDIIHGMSIFSVAFVRWLRLAPAETPMRYFAYVSTDPTSTLPIATRRFRRQLLLVRNAISRREAPKLEAIFTASKMVAERLGELGIKGRIIPIPGHVDADRLVQDAKRPIELRRGRPRIGFAGQLEPLKGVGDLITAFADIAPHFPDAVLLIAGVGPEKRRLVELADSLGIAERIEFTGYLDPVAPLLAALDVFVSASHSEALGTSILEAMALGVPCVCTDSGGPGEFIRDGVNGLLVPVADPAALSAAVLRVLGDQALASSLAEQGRATVCEGPYLLSATIDAVFAEYERSQLPAGATA